jgi:hypothetical protein
MKIHRVLDEVFRTWSHVAVLRALLGTKTGFTGSETARIAGMHPRSALKALSSLETLGLVRRQRGGRDHLFTLNQAHYLMREGILSLFRVEHSFFNAIRLELIRILAGKVLCAAIFGSVSKRIDTPESDLDICCITMTGGQGEIVRRALHEEAATLLDNFGVKIAPLFLVRSELKKRSRVKLIRDIAEHGIHIAGAPITELLDDAHSKTKNR